VYLEKVEAKVEEKAETKGEVEDKDKLRAEDREFHLYLAIFNKSQDAQDAAILSCGHHGFCQSGKCPKAFGRVHQ
jgi:hypothetical protein